MNIQNLGRELEGSERGGGVVGEEVGGENTYVSDEMNLFNRPPMIFCSRLERSRSLPVEFASQLR